MGFFTLAGIAPVSALRFTEKAGSPAGYCCPPYHAVPPGGQALLYGINPYNAVRLELPKDGDPYAEAAATYNAWKQGGILGRDGDAAFYLYRRVTQSPDGHTQPIDGLFVQIEAADVDVSEEDPVFGSIVEDRRRMIEAMMCQTGPVPCVYNDRDRAVTSLIHSCVACEPFLTFDLYHVTHTLWRLNDPDLMAALQAVFANKVITVADRHLYEAAKTFGPFLALLTDGTHSPYGSVHRLNPLVGLVMYDLC